jgi:restriction system protein
MVSEGVKTAIELLLEEVGRIYNTLNRELQKAVELEEFDRVQRITRICQEVKAFKEKVEDLQSEWRAIFSGVAYMPTKNCSGRKKENKSRLKRGLRTPEEKFILPILEALIELGGEAHARDVLERVHAKMKDILNNYDYEDLSSNNQKRWENTTQWVKYKMVEEGLLDRNVPRGVWRITEKGRKFYQGRKALTVQEIVRN